MNPNIAELARLMSFEISMPRRYEWDSIEAGLGTRLPSEYKEYVRYFPPGGHAEIVLAHPAVRDTYTRGLHDQIRIWAEMFGGFARLAGNTSTFYPDIDGLIPWAQYDAVAALCWRPAADEPDRWPVVACNDSGEQEQIEGTTVRALIRVLRGEVGRSVFPGYMYEAFNTPSRFAFWVDMSPQTALGPEEARI